MNIFTIASLFLLAACQSVPNSEKIKAFESEKHINYKLWNRTPDCCSKKGSKGAVASGGTHSSKAGIEILRRGGNVVDSAVATAFTLAVERPHSAGIGGGGFMTIHLNKKNPVDLFIDFRETAPKRSHRDMYLDKEGKVIPNMSLKGAMSVATPSFVMGLYEIHRKWGKLKWKEVLEPAITLAERGFLVYPSLHEHIEEEKECLTKEPYIKSILFKADKPLNIGDRLVQKDLANTIRTIAAQGGASFRVGDLGKKIVRFVKEKGGILEQSDLSKYPVKFRQPIKGNFQETNYISAPPPSAGGVLMAEALNVLSGYDLKSVAENPIDYIHLVTEVLKRAYADRSQIIGDSDFVKVDYSKLISKTYADELRKTIDAQKATPSQQIKDLKALKEPGTHTTHLSVMDDQGNAVSSTLTINYTFGSCLAVPGTGIILNDEMDDFSSKVGEANVYGLVSSEANAIAPGKRPVSSMTPTIFLKEGKPIFVVGAAGGSRIITSVLETSLNYFVQFSGNVKRAVFAPRFHHQWLPDKLNLEGGLMLLQEEMKSKGHTVVEPPFSPIVQAVGRTPDGQIMSAFDPRDEGGAEAY